MLKCIRHQKHRADEAERESTYVEEDGPHKYDDIRVANLLEQNGLLALARLPDMFERFPPSGEEGDDHDDEDNDDERPLLHH
ncbi:hypothetical protein J1N35_018178 [Gossypium stocksii]|uniref:Uncharacterized protein n=1 Tax=Gossypium stocksii TaxID=47602 RepID=A0A9D3VNH2_9ROSI|nr:hypothetical protein J1N35_018178 [Gossypium stocksii]